ncbi:MAG: VWA domain-containing protein [Planctomycetota bacterium]
MEPEHQESPAPESSERETESKLPPPLPRELQTARDRFVVSEPPPVEAELPSSSLVAAIQIVEQESDSTPRKESAVWSGSILLHVAILVVIGLLVAPTDLGGTAMHIIQLSFTNESNELKTESTIEFVSLETDSAPESVEIDVIAPEPVPTSNQGSFTADSTADTGRTAVDGGGPGADAARGSFFGIEASGQNFVYVLDQSGSMDGQRFRRAADELVRSVETLSEDQNFFVVLFNTQMHQMFDQRGLTPSPIPASAENKRKLARWLNDINPNGGTDPRMGLKLALQMKPSAVFMLSDGEFTDDKKRRSGILRADDGNTKQMVKRMEASVPIHAIAFEDPNSCVNMKELASLTGGEYRFVPEVRRSEDELLEMAVEAEAIADLGERAMKLTQLADEFADKRTSRAAKQQYREMLLDVATQTLETGQMMDTLVLVDRYRRVKEPGANDPEFEEVVDAIVMTWTQCEDAGTLIQAGKDLAKLPQSKEAEFFLQSLTPRLVDVASQVRPADTYHVLRELASRHGGTGAGLDCENARTAIFEDLTLKSNERRDDGDLIGALDLLSPLRMGSPNGPIGPDADQAVIELSREILAQVRDAPSLDAKEKIRETLRKTLRDDSLYERIRTRFGGSELQARKIMREATRALRIGDAELARRLLGSIVEHHSETISARRAERELENLGPAEIELDDSALFDQMMGVGPESDDRSD